MFPFFGATDLVVRKAAAGATTTTELVLGTDYTVAGGAGNDGSVTLTAGASRGSGSPPGPPRLPALLRLQAATAAAQVVYKIQVLDAATTFSGVARDGDEGVAVCRGEFRRGTGKVLRNL